MIFKNKNGEIRSGWVITIILAVWFLAIFFTGYLVSFFINYRIKAEAFANYDLYIDAFYAYFFGPIGSTLRYLPQIAILLLAFWLIYRRPFKQLGLYKDKIVRHLLLGGLFGIVLITLQVSLLLILGAARIESIDFVNIAAGPFWGIFINYAYVGVFEEILARGIMMTALKTTRIKWVIVVIPAVIFGVLHGLNNNVTLFSLVNVSLVGLLFAYLFIKTGHLWTPIGLHITWNFTMGGIFGISVSGNDHSSAAANVMFTGPDWLTGGDFGLEGGVICTFVIVAGLAFTHFFIRQSKEFWTFESDMPLAIVTSKE